MQNNYNDQTRYQTDPYGMNGNIATMTITEFFSKIYSTVALGVGLSALISVATAFIFPKMMTSMLQNPVIYLGLAIVELILVVVLSVKSLKDSKASIPLFFLYSALNGLTLSWIFAAYQSGTIALAFVSTFVAFLGISFYGRTTKRNLSGIGKAALAGMIGMVVLGILAGILSIFMPAIITPVSLGLSALGILVFSVLIAWDNQRLTDYYNSVGGAATNGMAVQGALQLYLDFINLFMSILRILGIFNRE